MRPTTLADMPTATKPRPFHDELLRELAHEYGTPLYVYDAGRAQAQVERLRGFDRVRYAMKANSNLSLLAVLRACGVGLDCVSAGEVHRALAAGFAPEQIVYTADLFDGAALDCIAAHGLHANLGSADMIEQYAPVSADGRVTLRINPGFGHGHDRKVNTGGERSKHGIWHAELPQAVQRARQAGLRVSGLHMHIGSGTDLEHLGRVCEAMRAAARFVGAELETVSAGGGLPIPYRAGEPELDVERHVEAWRRTRDELSRELGCPLEVEVEPGRFLVAECGVLLAEVRATKQVAGRAHLLLDAGFHTLGRPMMYGAFHQISIVGRDEEARQPTVVAGPLCEAADVFTQDNAGAPQPQDLPAARAGDLACFHDAGAYGMSMASNYNSQPLPAEVLLLDGRAHLVRVRQETSALCQPELDGLNALKGALSAS